MNRLNYGTQRQSCNADDSLATDTGATSSHAYVYDVNGRTTTDGCTTYGYDGLDRQITDRASVTTSPVQKVNIAIAVTLRNIL